MNNLLSFENQEVEVLEVNGTIYFNPYHIANILDIKNVRDNLRTMNENQVIKLTNSGVGNTDIRKLNNAGELFLTESGVYKLIFKSRKPNAEKFADWVTDEVLPAIRKTGKYEATPTLTRKTYMVLFFCIFLKKRLTENIQECYNAIQKGDDKNQNYYITP